jgi:hypothetical protein
VFTGSSKERAGPLLVFAKRRQPSADYISAPDAEQDQPAWHEFIWGTRGNGDQSMVFLTSSQDSGMLRLLLMRFGLFFPVATVVVWRLRVMMLKLSPVRLAGKDYRLVPLAMRFLVAGIFMLGALSANAGEPIIVPIHNVKVVKLDRDASVVLIANPVIANVAVESKRLIFVFGLEPGETNLVVLDSEGEEILTEPVVVVPILERRVTVSRVNVNEEAAYS